MKSLPILLALTAVAGADDILPQPFPQDRYEETLKTSPFVLETKTAEAPVVEKINVFQNLYLRGVGKADGKDYVIIQRLGEERPMRFIGNEAGSDGLKVKTVRMGDSFRGTKVVLEKGTETGEVGFKEDTLNAPPAAAAGAGPGRGPGQPGQFPMPGTGKVPQPIPSMRPPQATQPAQPVPRPQGMVPSPSIPQPSGSSKGRVRVINN